MRMERLDSCPGCGSGDLRLVYAPNDLAEHPEEENVDPELLHSDFTLCGRCDLIFARWRQALEEFRPYYENFAKWEDRLYDVYPPPPSFIRSKQRRAAITGQFLEAHGLLRKDATVLHIRCDYGSLGLLLRDQYQITNVFGLEHFQNNVRAAREDNRLPHVACWIPGKLEIPFGPATFDVIVCNHQITHAPRPRQFLEELRARLSPGGALLVHKEVDHVAMFASKRLGNRGINNFHKQLLTRQSLKNLLRLSGFEDPRIEYPVTEMDMGFLVRPGTPLDPGHLPPPDPEPVLRAMRRWIRGHEAILLARRIVDRLKLRGPLRAVRATGRALLGR